MTEKTTKCGTATQVFVGLSLFIISLCGIAALVIGVFWAVVIQEFESQDSWVPFTVIGSIVLGCIIILLAYLGCIFNCIRFGYSQVVNVHVLAIASIILLVAGAGLSVHYGVIRQVAFTDSYVVPRVAADYNDFTIGLFNGCCDIYDGFVEAPECTGGITTEECTPGFITLKPCGCYISYTQYQIYFDQATDNLCNRLMRSTPQGPLVGPIDDQGGCGATVAVNVETGDREIVGVAKRFQEQIYYYYGDYVFGTLIALVTIGGIVLVLTVMLCVFIILNPGGSIFGVKEKPSAEKPPAPVATKDIEAATPVEQSIQNTPTVVETKAAPEPTVAAAAGASAAATGVAATNVAQEDDKVNEGAKEPSTTESKTSGVAETEVINTENAQVKPTEPIEEMPKATQEVATEQEEQNGSDSEDTLHSDHEQH